MSDLERRCRLLLRAWPWRDRVERGDELVGTMLDVIGDGRSWPPLALAVDMVVAGLRARHRRRPPLSVRVRYSCNRTVEHQWHEWVLDRLLMPGWRWRMVLSDVHPAIGMFAWFTWFAGADWLDTAPLILLIEASVITVAYGYFGVRQHEQRRRKKLDIQGYGLVGSPPRVVTHLVWQERAARFINLRPAPVMAATGGPLVHAGVQALAAWPLDPLAPGYPAGMERSIMIVALALTMVVGAAVRAHRVPVGSPGSPASGTLWIALTAFATSVITSSVVTGTGSLGSNRGMFLAAATFGVIGAALVLGAVVLVAEGLRLGRPVGLFDVWPNLAPQRVAAKSRMPWSFAPPVEAGDRRTVT